MIIEAKMRTQKKPLTLSANDFYLLDIFTLISFPHLEHFPLPCGFKVTAHPHSV
jgi:hypothetical protein